ncbi:Fat storage-inducing transmembrane protein [Abortiporus biennis]
MPTFTTSTLLAVTAIVSFGTLYSIVYSTYLDTSDPFLTHLPHHLHATHYFASKANPLNIYFIKQIWGWTTFAFLFLYMTSPKIALKPRRIAQYILETLVWLIFTSWFFGPPVLDRLNVSTGGECVIVLPSGAFIPIPGDYCYTKSTVITPETHPHLFGASLILPEPGSGWVGKPRIRRGHDVSGHLFLLTMAVLFLADQIQWSFARGLVSRSTESREEDQQTVVKWSKLHKWAVGFNLAVILLSLLSIYSTSVYFHTPFEKLTGYLLGVSGFALTQLPIFNLFGSVKTSFNVSLA